MPQRRWLRRQRRCSLIITEKKEEKTSIKRALLKLLGRSPSSVLPASGVKCVECGSKMGRSVKAAAYGRRMIYGENNAYAKGLFIVAV